MKKIFLLTLMSVLSLTTFAQSGKIAYLYSEKVFKAMPEYEIGIKKIEEFAAYGSERSKLKLDEVESMFNDFKERGASMSASARDIFKQEIIAKEKSANEFKENFFKEGGDLERKQKEIMKPIEEKVLAVVNAIAEEDGYDIIFDLSTSKTTIYQKATLDLTNEVINRIKK